MTPKRKKQLQQNSALLFWGRSLMNIKVLNAVLSLFYAAHGLTGSQIIWVSLFWAVATLLFEIPSSYMADRWGRKKTLLFGTMFGVAQWAIYLHADGFWWIAAGMFCFGIFSASFSGTDIALLYDSKRELAEESESLKEMGKYSSAMNMFKVFSALLGAYIAKDLSPAQFDIIIWIDICATICALLLFFRLTEPNHHMDLEEQEAGIFFDAAKLLRGNPGLQRAIINRVMVFLVSYAVWTYFQVLYTSLGVTVMAIGIGWSTYHLVTFFAKRYTHVAVQKYGIAGMARYSAILWCVCISAIVVLYYLGVSGWVLFVLYIISATTLSVRSPLFDDIFNSYSASYNRATVLSLSNLLHNVLEFPVILFAGLIVGMHPMYPYIFGVIIVILVLRFSPVTTEQS